MQSGKILSSQDPYRSKSFNYDNYEQAYQKAVRGKAAFNDFKAEIEFRDLRAKQHERDASNLVKKWKAA